MFHRFDRPLCMILILQKVLNISFEKSTEVFGMWLEMVTKYLFFYRIAYGNLFFFLTSIFRRHLLAYYNLNPDYSNTTIKLSKCNNKVQHEEYVPVTKQNIYLGTN